MQTIVREALEPNLLIVPNCFQTVNIPQGRMVQIGALGAMVAAMIPEGGLQSAPSPTAMSGNTTGLNCGDTSMLRPTNYSGDTSSIVRMEGGRQSAAKLVIDQPVQRLHGRPRHTVNETFFDEWNEPMAYILGYIYGDGTIATNKHRMSISSKDREHLHKIGELLAPTIPLRKQSNKYGVWYTLTVNRKYMVDRLKELGVTPRKSLTMEFPTVPSEYLPHFIRGYFDADGCIHKYKNRCAMQIDFACGSESFISTLHTVLNDKLSDIFQLAHRRTNYWRIRGNTAAAMALFYYMYDNASVFLWRKFDKYSRAMMNRVSGDDIVQSRYDVALKYPETGGSERQNTLHRTSMWMAEILSPSA